jgi:NDP-sugar pyrophosphorylase family protein
MTDLTAIVMAAGRGSRLAPLTDRIPKPLLPIAGRAVIDGVLDSLLHAGISRVTVVTGHLEKPLRRHLAARPHDGLDIQLAHQTGELRSPAQSVLCAIWAGHPVGRTLITVADTLWSASDVAQLAAAGQGENCMSVSRADPDGVPGGLVSAIDEEQMVIEVLTEPHGLEGAAYPAGMNVVSPAFFAALERHVQAGEANAFALALQDLADGEGLRAVEVARGAQLTDHADLLRLNFEYLAPHL